jgi:hypothetical protein
VHDVQAGLLDGVAAEGDAARSLSEGDAESGLDDGGVRAKEPIGVSQMATRAASGHESLAPA